MKDIIQWLQGPRDFDEGVSIYLQYGQNRRLRYVFTHQADQLTRDTLVEQLRIIAGISEHELKGLRRKAARPAVVQEASPTQKPRPASQEQVERIRFRDKYPFMADADCPDVLKVAVADLFTAYGRYREGHAALLALQDDEDVKKAEVLCRDIVENYLLDRYIIKELEYYKQNHQLLGEAEVVQKYMAQKDLSSLSDVELLRQRNSAAVNVSKAKKRIAESEGKDTNAAALFDKWNAKKAAIDAEIERRKKN